MNRKKYSTIYLIILFVSILLCPKVFADSATVEALKTQIFDNYGITVQDSDNTYGMGWTEEYLRAMTEVFQDMPESFTAATRMVYISPVEEQYEIKYNGYNEEYGIIQFGSEAFSPSSVYLTQFKKVYDSEPSNSDKINRFKTMLVRGMAYSFIQSNTDAYGRSDLIQSYQSIYADNASFSTKLYSLGNENYMVVAPGKNHLWTDLAFAVAQYCTNASGLRSDYPKRYNFVKEYIFDGNGVDGWPEKYLDGTGKTSGGDGHTGGYNGTDTVTSTNTSSNTNTQTQTNTQSQTDTQTNTGSDTNSDTDSDTDSNTDTSSDTNSDTDTGTSSSTDSDTSTSTDSDTNSDTDTGSSTDTGTDTDIEYLNDRTDIPSIPEGNYLPVVSQVDVGSIGLDSSRMTMPDGMKKAIKELFEELPKYFSTCTLGISYMPTKDTCDAFSSEGYIFVTNNSWFAPSFANLDDETRAKRFKQILVREMTNCFLYYHQSKISRWRGTFGKEITEEEAKTDIIESTVYYYTDDNYLESLEALKWSFIKTNIFSNE